MKSWGIVYVITIHPKGNMNVFTNFHDNRSIFSLRPDDIGIHGVVAWLKVKLQLCKRKTILILTHAFVLIPIILDT